MYGGDWPISVLSGGYDRVWDGLTVLFDELSDADRARILGETAIEFYRIDPRRLKALRPQTGK
jgi:L-fuconolactonase